MKIPPAKRRVEHMFMHEDGLAMPEKPSCECSWCQASYHRRAEYFHLNNALVSTEEDNVNLFYAREELKAIKKRVLPPSKPKTQRKGGA